MKKKIEITVFGCSTCFHEDCPECKNLMYRMIALDKELTSLREQRKEHMRPIRRVADPLDTNRPYEKVNLHIEPGDINIPSTWHEQATRIADRLRNGRRVTNR